MAEISGLSVRVSSSVAQFRAGMSSAQESAQDLSLSLRRLGQSSSSAERDLDSAGRSATTTAGQFTALTAGTNGLNASFMGLSVVTIGALIPSLLTLLTVVSPLVAALGGFVAIAGAIVGVGFAGALGAILTNTEMLKQEALALAETLGNAFAPAIEEATTVLLLLMRSFRDIIPALVPSQAAIEDLGLLFLELGRAMIEALPGLVELAVTLTREFLPALIEFVDDVGPRLPEIVMAFVDSMREVNDILGPLGSELRAMLPVLNRFGTEVLSTIVPALSRFVRLSTNAMQSVNEMDSGLRSLVISGVILLPVLTTLVGFISGPFALAIGTIAATVAGLGALFVTNFGGMRDTFNRLLPTLREVGSAIRTGLGAFLEGFDMSQVLGSLDALANTLRSEYQKSLPILVGHLEDFAAVLRNNQEEIAVFGSLASTVLSGILDFIGVLIQAGGFMFRNVFAPGIGLVIDLLDVMLTKMANGIKLFSALQEGDFQQAAGLLEDIAIGEGNNIPTGGFGQQPQTQQQQQEVLVMVEEDTDLTNARIQEQSQQVLTEEERRQRRNSGRTADL